MMYMYNKILFIKIVFLLCTSVPVVCAQAKNSQFPLRERGVDIFLMRLSVYHQHGAELGKYQLQVHVTKHKVGYDA